MHPFQKSGQAYDYWQDQPGSIPQRHRAPHEPAAPVRERTGSRRARPSFARSIRFGQIGAGEGPMPTASTESENSSRRSRTTPSHDEARKAWDARAAFGFTPHMECKGRKATDCT
ncbi:hypothetical protein KY290_038117 [Solanum tuberosum]|uniref:Integrase core domain containing protein n=1 Tax=Solanum tuberosum TaxID=4113 RepID=A0ABQ7TZB2_SOLTU|nr:hypothetical protein KY289_012407 [Solanum tuberosum]KAH0739412.1 hypothetical protein KY290_038117 [Solanum tuberosum]